MKVVNVHSREIQQPIAEIARLFNTLASENDMILATDKWSPMKLDKGLQIGSKGGHGPIKYFVTAYQPEKSITFQFDMEGFIGFHTFELNVLEMNTTELTHRIEMTTTGTATIKWALVIRWLHDAFIEDAFDRVENYFSKSRKRSEWTLWVKTLMRIMKYKKN